MTGLASISCPGRRRSTRSSGSTYPASPEATPVSTGASAASGESVYSEGPAQALAIEAVLEGLGRGEGQLLGGRDFDGGAGGRIAAVALRRCLHLELAEAWQGNFFAGGSRLGNRLEHAIDHCLALSLGQAVFGCKLVGDLICSGH